MLPAGGVVAFLMMRMSVDCLSAQKNKNCAVDLARTDMEI
jgi:hypothetical protein